MTRIAALAFMAGLLSSCVPTYMPLGPATSSPRIEGDVFIARDGVRLPLSVWGPREHPTKVVVAAHSFGEFRDAYALIGEHLTSRNIAVWAYDQRGFGDAPHHGLWASGDTLTQDFQDFTAAVQEIAGEDLPLVMFGESMGASVVLSALSKSNTLKPESVILSGPGVRENRPGRYWYNVGLWVATHIWPSYEARVQRSYDDRLADHHAKRWAEDSKIIDRVRVDTYFGLVRLSDQASNTANLITTPALVLFGTEDTQIHPKSLCALMGRLGSNGTLQIFKGKPHLMFQIKEQQEVLPVIDQWLAEPGQIIESDQQQFCSA